MHLKVGFAWTKVESASAAEEAFLREYLTFREKGLRGSTKTRSLLRPGRMFPSGLAPRLVHSARNLGMEVQVTRRSNTLELRAGNTYQSWTARPHQAEAIERVLERPRGLIQHATGAGKGDLICFLACRVIQGRTLIITSSRKLLDDLYRRCDKFGVRAGRLGGGFAELTRPIIVSTDDSLKKLTEAQLLSFKAVLVDECHGVGAAGLWTTLMRCLNAEVRLGFSATSLDRADRKGLYIVGALGDTIHRYSPEQAARDGVIAQARLRMLQHTNQPFSTADGYVNWEREAIAKNAARNLKLRRILSECPAPRIVFVRTKEHQDELVRSIGELYCAAVNDQTPPDEVEKIIKRLKDGTLPTLVSTPIFRQGVDIPEIRSVVNGAGGKAVIDVIQKVGRGSRRQQSDGTTKDEFWVYDLYDRGCGCEGAHKGCEWFEKHSAARKAAYEKFGYRVLEH